MDGNRAAREVLESMLDRVSERTEKHTLAEVAERLGLDEQRIRARAAEITATADKPSA